MSGFRPADLARAGLVLVAAAMLAFLFLPLLALFIQMPPAALLAKLGSRTSLVALRLSAATSVTALAAIVVVGTPLAYLLARAHWRGKGVAEALLRLPIVTPPAVAGVGLLLVFGRFGLLGGVFSALGIQIGFRPVAVVLAQGFIAAPFYIQAARQAFAAVDDSLLAASRTLGHGPWSTFLRVTVPLALPGLVSGATLAWARALGEFGATMMFAGNLPGVTQTLPLAIYTAMQSDVRVAIAISVLLMLVALVVLLAVSALERRPLRQRERPRPAREGSVECSTPASLSDSGTLTSS